MASRGGKFVSNIGEVSGLADDAITGILNDVAAQAEAYAKENVINNDTVDTGFMLNSIYGLTTKSDGVPGETQTVTDKNGQTVERESSGLPGTDKDSSMVGAGANYAIFQELQKPFLGPAGDKVKDDVPRFIEKRKLK